MSLAGDIEPKKVETFEREKAELQEEITALDQVVEELKVKRKATAKHIPFGELPEIVCYG